MTPIVVRRSFALCLVVSLVASVPMARADERTIRCESRNNRYQFCQADTDKRVQLVRPLSSARRCVQGYSWGYDERGVWVDRGCRAEFLVGRDGMGTGTKVAIGAAVGAAILGAVIASKAGGDKAERAPEWMVGTFRGHDYLHDGAELEVTIAGDGSLRGYADGEPVSGRYAGKNRLVLEGREYDVRREGMEGLHLEQVADKKNSVFLWKVS